MPARCSDRKLAVALLLIIAGALWFALMPTRRQRTRARSNALAAAHATDAGDAPTTNADTHRNEILVSPPSSINDTSMLAFPSPADDPFYADWHGPDAIRDHLTTLARRYNDPQQGLRVIVESIGKSIEGRPILLLKATATTGESKTKTGPRKMFVLGGQHGREWISHMATIFAVHGLLHAHARGGGRAVLNHLALHAAPLLNPDGLAYSRTTDTTKKPKRGTKGEPLRMWRKNRRAHPLTGSVDLNRNWGTQKPVFVVNKQTKGNPLASGPKGFSEPETDAVRRYFAAQPAGTGFDAFVDIHCCMHCVLGPHNFTWGWDDRWSISDADAARLERVGTAMAQAANAVSERQSEALLLQGVENLWDVVGFTRYLYRERTKSAGALSNNAVSWAFHEAKVPLSFALETRGREAMNNKEIKKGRSVLRSGLTKRPANNKNICARKKKSALSGLF